MVGKSPFDICLQATDSPMRTVVDIITPVTHPHETWVEVEDIINAENIVIQLLDDALHVPEGVSDVTPSFGRDINRTANAIARGTLRGAGNVVMLHPSWASAVDECRWMSRVLPNVKNDGMAFCACWCRGYFDARLPKHIGLIALKGAGEIDAGVHFLETEGRRYLYMPKNWRSYIKAVDLGAYAKFDWMASIREVVE